MKTFIKTIFTASLITLISLSSYAQTKLAVPQQQNSKEKVSDTEVKQFANAFQQIQTKSAGIQKEMTEIIQGEGMEIKRYMEIQQSSQNPDADAQITDEEQSQLDKINPKLEKLQADTKVKMQKVIEENGLSSNRYNEIAGLLRNDTDLQMRVKALLKD